MAKKLIYSLILGLVLLGVSYLCVGKGTVDISEGAQLDSFNEATYAAHGYPFHYFTTYNYSISGNSNNGLPTRQVSYGNAAADYGLWALGSFVVLLLLKSVGKSKK
jgi:hypothetical protein